MVKRIEFRATADDLRVLKELMKSLGTDQSNAIRVAMRRTLALIKQAGMHHSRTSPDPKHQQHDDKSI